MTNTTHWTEKNINAFVNRLSFDLVTQLSKKMDSLSITQSEFAEKLGLTKGRVSQIFNNPGNLTLNKMCQYANALEMKITIVAYENECGPVHSEIFNLCWEKTGKPTDFWEISNPISITQTSETTGYKILEHVNFQSSASNNSTVPQIH